MKICFKCNKKKDLSKYYIHPQMKDGHLNKCIECTKKDVNKYRKDNLNYCTEYDRLRATLPHRVQSRKDYQKTENGKKSIRKSHLKWIANNPEKRAAHIILNNRLREGKIKKKRCEKCGEKKSHAHHRDYSKPLDVKWLCIKCHSFRHKVLDLRNKIQ
jgi:formylmethanofuran dehydrogenase subunit E